MKMVGKLKKNNSTTWVDVWKELSEDRKELNRVKEKQENILASIQYARRIQDALLITREELKDIFNDFSIVYEPKDIVSGDFYYAEKHENKKTLVVR